MHPLLRARSSLVLYLVLWVGLAVVPFSLLREQATGAAALAVSVLSTTAFALFTLPTYYLCRASPFQGEKAGRSLTLLFLGVALGSLFYRLLIELSIVFVRAIDPGLTLAPRWNGELGFYAVGLLFSLFVLSLNYLWIEMEARRRAGERAAELVLLASNAELQALRAQVHPHFLFNSLNTVNSLIGSDPERAREACLLLAEYLRGTLKAQEIPLVPFADEWALCETYLKVEALRFEERLNVQTLIEPEAERILIPSLLLQPLIENAVRHGAAALLEPSNILLKAKVFGASLVVTIENEFDPLARHRRHRGIGLSNVRARLHAHYSVAATLRLEEETTRFLVRLELPAVAMGGS